MRFIRSNGFLLGLLVSLGGAWLLPEAGMKGGWLRSEWTGSAGIAVIFFNLGLVLPSERLREDLMEWRLHLFVQGFTYVVIPAVVLAAGLVAGSRVPEDMRIGFLYLAVLPTTISTAVVFTMQTGGNLAGAIFNTSVSNLLGVFVVPAWMVWALSAARGVELPLWPILGKLCLLLLLPLVIGQAVRPLARSLLANAKMRVARINTAIIFFLVYAAFCDSVHAGIWRGKGMWLAGGALAGAAGLLAVASLACWGGVRAFGFPTASARAAFFCGSQKSLAAGVAMAGPLFGASGLGQSTGVILLPILCYHVLQLLLGGWLAGRWGPGGDVA